MERSSSATSKRSCAFERESAALRRFRAAAIALALLIPSRAHAVRFALGVASDFTPIVLDPNRGPDASAPILVGFRPVLDVELNHYLSFGAYPPFTVYRSAANSTGAESVFGLGASLRKPFLFDTAPEEILAYVTGRFGFGTVNGRAGPFYGGALGVSVTWLDTGRGVFGELGLSKLHVNGLERAGDTDRTMIGLSVGILFHLGGEDWRIGRTKISDEEK
jgi:hypothetical protein